MFHIKFHVNYITDVNPVKDLAVSEMNWLLLTA